MSSSYHNNTLRIAARAGFGWCGWEEGYLGNDMVISKWMFSGRESPLFVASLPDAHNFGITYAPDEFALIFDIYPNKRFISINEFIGYLHAANSGNWTGENELVIEVNYDSHYCRYFEKNPTRWNMEFADWLTEKVGNQPAIKIDGKKADINKIHIPAGLGKHVVEVIFDAD